MLIKINKNHIVDKKAIIRIEQNNPNVIIHLTNGEKIEVHINSISLSTREELKLLEVK